MGMTVAQYNAVLKDVYQGPIRNQIRKQTAIYDRVKKVGEHIVQNGRQAVFPILLGWPQGIGAANDGAPLPDAGQSRYVDCLVPIKHTYARIQVTGPVMRASENNAGAFASVKSSEMQNQIDAFMRDYNRSICTGTGVGSLATVTADIAVGDTIITVDSTVNVFEGARYELWTNPTVGGGTQGETILVVSILSDTTFSIAAPGAANIYLAINVIKLIRKGAKEAEVLGISGLIDDGSNLSVLQGVDRTVERLWRSPVDDPGVPTVLTLDDLRSNKNKSEKAGGKPVVYTTYELMAAYEKICQEQKRFVNVMKFDKGFHREAISYDGAPIFNDEQMPAGYWVFADEKQLAFHQQMEMQWLAPAGSEMLPVSGFDMVEMILALDNQFGISRCNTSVSMRNRITP